MPRIFISYRNSDSKTISGRIYDRLTAEFGERAIFKDTQDIPPGKDWRGVLREKIGGADVVLVVIGTGWLDAQDTDGNRRLDKSDDWVRFEVETALQRDDVRVVPLLVNGATPLPAAQLPDTLRELAYKQAQVIREDPDFPQDMQKLIKSIRSMRRNFFTDTMLGRLASIATILALLVSVIALVNQIQSNSNSAIGATNGVIPTEEVTATPEAVAQVTTEPASPTASHTATLTPSATSTATDAPSATPTATDAPSATSTPSVAANSFTLTFDRNFSGIALCLSTASSGIDLNGLEILLPDSGGSGELYVLGTVFTATGVSTTLGNGECLCIQRQNLSGLAQCNANNTSPAQRSSGDWVNTPITLLLQGQSRQIPASCQTDCDVLFEG